MTKISNDERSPNARMTKTCQPNTAKIAIRASDFVILSLLGISSLYSRAWRVEMALSN